MAIFNSYVKLPDGISSMSSEADGMFVMEGDEVVAVNGTLCEGAWRWARHLVGIERAVDIRRFECVWKNFKHPEISLKYYEISVLYGFMAYICATIAASSNVCKIVAFSGIIAGGIFYIFIPPMKDPNINRENSQLWLGDWEQRQMMCMLLSRP